MAPRLHVLLLVVALVARLSMQSDDDLSDVAERCRTTVGEQAAEDVLRVGERLLTCIGYKDYLQQMRSIKVLSARNDAFQAYCRRKAELLTCFDQAIQTVEPCLNQEERQSLAILHKLTPPVIDYACKHSDEIVAVFGSMKELQCARDVQGLIQMCTPENVQEHTEKLLPSFKYLQQECKDIDEFLDCITPNAGNCKGSIALRFHKGMIREVMDEICPEVFQASSVSGVLTYSGTLPEPL